MASDSVSGNVVTLFDSAHNTLGSLTFQTGRGAPDAAGANLAAAQIACFAEGTHIATPAGPVAVEDLRAGDSVMTHDGRVRPVRWIGHRTLDLTRHADPVVARPVRIAAGAFADNVPHRDLRVSPDHALLVDGRLIPARLLINGASIVMEAACRRVTYYHVELDSHDILLAEGMPAESYLDTGNRAMFANGGGALTLHPDFGQAPGEGRVPVPATPLSLPALSVLAGPRRLKPVASHGGRYVFVIPPGGEPLWLVVQGADSAGARIRGLVSRGKSGPRAVPLDDPDLQQGWLAPDWLSGVPCRWMGTRARLPELGQGLLEVEVDVAEMARVAPDRAAGQLAA